MASITEITAFDDRAKGLQEVVWYEDSFWDQTKDGPINVWTAMFEYAAEKGYTVDVESIRFSKVFSPMIGSETELVGFNLGGRLFR